MLRADALALAVDIADSLCSTAWVSDGAATWLGTRPTYEEDGQWVQRTVAVIGPSVYSGTAGVALFLAEVFAHSRKRRHADVASAAMAYACARTGWIAPDTRFGFYSGTVGIAWALVRAGELLERPEYLMRARQLLGELQRDMDDDFLLDVTGGAAGGATALLSLQHTLGMDGLAGVAHTLGTAMVHAATRTDTGWSWGERASGDDTEPHLTGFAHGAAGIGWSLLELSIALGNPAFRQGALEAFRYESHCFEPVLGNWPDFRDTEPGEPPSCPVAWCHGAGGIGLSRLRACAALGDPWARADLEAAARTVRRTLESPDDQQEMSYTLCHGQGSLAEFLGYAGRVLGDPEAVEVANGVAHRGAARYAGHPARWLSGYASGGHPSLMLGLAGIGHYYLRIATPSVPSVLLCGTAAPVDPVPAP